MLAMDAGMYIYSGFLGGLIGAVVIAFALRRNHLDNIKLMESYWRNDMRTLRLQIAKLKLCTKSVNNSVKNDKNVSVYNS